MTRIFKLGPLTIRVERAGLFLAKTARLELFGWVLNRRVSYSVWRQSSN